MPRQLRIEYEGAIYHVMSRGDQREPIFEDDKDRKTFLKTLAQACEKAEWEIHAYCLMTNHFHIIMETPKPTLVAGMKWFLGTYTQRYNARHKAKGHLFSGRYKSLLVDESDDFYLRSVCDYVHLNPVRAGLVEAGSGLESYPWSSYRNYLQPAWKRKPWLRVDRLLGDLGCRDNGRGRREFKTYMEGRANQEQGGKDDMAKHIRRGWRFGAADFLKRLQEKVKLAPKRSNHRPEEVAASMEAKANGIIAEELAARNLTLRELETMKKMHPVKAEIARRLRKETTMTWVWIAPRLNGSSPSTMTSTVYQLEL
jgi:REP element-mobilizing transposase RayT